MIVFVENPALQDVAAVVVVLALGAVETDAQGTAAANAMAHVVALVAMDVQEAVPVETYSQYINERE